jgi:uncharacterized protein YndB with AHSA1/START domain
MGAGWAGLVLLAAAAEAPRPIESIAREAIEKEVVVEAPLAQVWAAWTRNDVAATWLAESTHIDPVLGGPYEVYFLADAPYGGRGCEGCRVRALEPTTHLAFSWSAPPQFPTIRTPGLTTVVDLRFEALGATRTRVLLTQYGWGVGGEWAGVRRYFETAWDVVLGRLQHRFAAGPIDWRNPPEVRGSFARR